LLQIAQALQKKQRRVLYVSGEESAQQIKMRAERLGSQAEGEIYILAESSLEVILAAVD
jgi:DNA repair protein RadA/Sms